MKRFVVFAMALALVLVGAASVVKAASLEDAKALAIEAAKYGAANGKDKLIAEINNPKGKFVKGDLYVTLQAMDGKVLGNPMLPAIIGQNHWDLKDPNGKFFVREMVEAAKKGGGWVTYTWTNAATKKVQPKKSWIQKVEGADMYTLCGIWQ